MGGGDHGRLGAGPDPILDERLPLLVVAIVFVFAIFGVRFFQLQILRGEELKGVAQGNALGQGDAAAQESEDNDGAYHEADAAHLHERQQNDLAKQRQVLAGGDDG